MLGTGRHTTERLSLTGLFLIAATVALAVAGAVSLMDARDGWQEILNTLQRSWLKGSVRCPGQFAVSGFDDRIVLCGLAITVGLLALTGYAADRGWRLFGTYAAIAALVPIGVLWIDTLVVAGSSIGDCDGAGLSGAAGSAIVRAGWAFFGASVLCLEAVAWTSNPDGPGSLSPQEYRRTY